MLSGQMCNNFISDEEISMHQDEALAQCDSICYKIKLAAFKQSVHQMQLLQILFAI